MRGHLGRRTLHAWLDGELDPRARREASRHLERCRACRRRLHELLALDARLDALREPVSPHRDLWSEIEERVRAADPGSRRADRAPGRRPAGVHRGRTLAAAVALVAGGVLFLVRVASDGDGAAGRSAERVDPGSGAASVVGIEREYGPAIDRLTRLVDARSRELDFDLAATAAADLGIIRASRREIREALHAAAGDAGLLAELEQGYRSEIRYLERLVSFASF